MYLLLETTTKWFSYRPYSELKDDEQYPGYNMLYLPAVENREPIEIALTLERLSALVDEFNNNNLLKKEVDYTKYYWRDDGKKDFNIAPVDKLIEYSEGVMTVWETMRDDLQLLKKEVEKDFWKERNLVQIAYGFYLQHGKLVINYLQCRACDIVRFGEKVADLTFPQPTLPGVTTERIADAVNWMVNLLYKLTDPDGEKEYIKLLAHNEYRLRKDSDEKFSKQIIPMPDIRRNELAYNEIEDLKAACLRELSQEGWNPQATLDVIDEFVEFCILLPKPENLLKTRTGQLVTHRNVPDMEAEASLELVNLDPYTAEAKLIREGKQGEVRIKTEELPDPRWEGKELENLISQIKENMISMGYVKKRSDIVREITQRQEEWRSLISNSKRQIPPSVEPPPTSSN